MIIGVLALQGDYEAHEKILSRVLARREDFAARVVQVRTTKELSSCDALVIPGGESTTMSRLCDRYELWNPLREKLESGMAAFGTCAGLIMLAKNIEGTTRNFEQKTLGVLDIDVTRNAYGAQLDSFETDIELSPREYSRNEAAAQSNEVEAAARDSSQASETTQNGLRKIVSSETPGAFANESARNSSRVNQATRNEAQSSEVIAREGAARETLRGVFIRAPRISRCGEGVEVLASHEGEAVVVRQGKIVAAAFHPEVCGEARLHELWLDLIVD